MDGKLGKCQTNVMPTGYGYNLPDAKFDFNSPIRKSWCEQNQIYIVHNWIFQFRNNHKPASYNLL